LQSRFFLRSFQKRLEQLKASTAADRKAVTAVTALGFFAVPDLSFSPAAISKTAASALLTLKDDTLAVNGELETTRSFACVAVIDPKKGG
jgi:hypothetical protein